MNEKLKSCECPLEFSADSTLIEDYSNLFMSSFRAEFEVSDNNVKFDDKLNETEAKLNRTELTEMFRSGYNCVYEVSVLYFLYKPHYEESKLCLNLEMDLTNQDLIIWRKPKVIQEYKQIVFPCLERSKKALETHLNDLSASEKEIIEEVVEGMKSLENVCNDFMKNLEENLGKYKEFNEKMKKLNEEKCSCGKK